MRQYTRIVHPQSAGDGSMHDSRNKFIPEFKNLRQTLKLLVDLRNSHWHQRHILYFDKLYLRDFSFSYQLFPNNLFFLFFCVQLNSVFLTNKTKSFIKSINRIRLKFLHRNRTMERQIESLNNFIILQPQENPR